MSRVHLILTYDWLGEIQIDLGPGRNRK